MAKPVEAPSRTEPTDYFADSIKRDRGMAQTLATERERRSVVPLSFWLFSVAGGLTLLAYAIYRVDPVFIIAEAMTLLIYARNLYFISHRRHSME